MGGERNFSTQPGVKKLRIHLVGYAIVLHPKHLVPMNRFLPNCLLLLVLVGLASGCKKSSDDTPPAAADFPTLLTSGTATWTVSSFTQTTEDKTKQVAGMTILFKSGGTATATLNGKSTAGNWSWGGNSYYGTPADSKTVLLNFGATAPYDRLSKTWTIMEQSSSVMKLDNANPAEGEHLVLNK